MAKLRRFLSATALLGLFALVGAACQFGPVVLPPSDPGTTTTTTTTMASPPPACGGSTVAAIEPIAVVNNACSASNPVRGTVQGTDAAVSADGRFVAFISDSSLLVAGDTNHENDVFVRDRVNGTVQRVSVWTDGTQAVQNANTSHAGVDDPAISADGRYVTFWSWHALAPGAQEGAGHTYVHDRQTGTTALVPVRLDGLQPSSSETPATMSDDGRYIAFGSSADNLVANDVDPVPGGANSFEDVFVKDQVTGSTTLVSVADDGGGAVAEWPVISGNGRYDVFLSESPNLVPGDTNGCRDIFVRDLVANTTERVNVTTAGAQVLPDLDGSCPDWMIPASITDDGRYVAFASAAWNLYGLTAPVMPGQAGIHVYVRDRAAGTTTRVDPAGTTATAKNPSISDDGRYVGYTCVLCDSVRGVFVKDMVGGTTRRLGVPSNGATPDGDDTVSFVKSMTADGHYMTFTSTSTNLAPNDGNHADDLYIQRIS